MSVLEPIIRTADPSDAALISELVAQYWAFEGIDGYSAKDVEALLAGALATPDRVLGWIAECNGVAIGYLLAVLMFSLEHRGVMAEVDELFVVPHARAAGVGAALVFEAERALSARGVVRMQLQLGVENARAHAFYARNGYAHRSGYDLWDKSLTVV
jgi:GNAT superfamily N-acetyltransferase